MRESGRRPAARQLRGSQPLISEHSAGTEGLPPIGAAAHWQQTLWAMVGIQFVMTAAFSMLMLLGTQGQQFTFAELKGILEAAGFTGIETRHTCGYYSITTGYKGL